MAILKNFHQSRIPPLTESLRQKHSHRTWVEIDAQALHSNVQTLRTFFSPGTKFLAVVKANAYGHGLAEVAHELGHDVDWFGVDSLDEALTLRALHVLNPILILGYTLRERLDEVVAADLSQTVYDTQTLRALGAAAMEQGNNARVHLKIETGTTRQGAWPEDFEEIFKTLRAVPQVTLEGVSTHLANVEDTADPRYMRQQISRFNEAVRMVAQAGFSGFIKHVGASAAAILYPESHFDLVRVGIALYGLWPSQGVRDSVIQKPHSRMLLPVLSWKTRIAQIKRVPMHTPVSYGLTERLTRDSIVAVLPIGYADGFDRRLSKAGEVLIRGKKAKVLGRVCMNMVMVDATDIPAVQAEDEVVLIGSHGTEQLGAEDLAEKIGTINYEVVSRINPRLARIVVGNR